MIESVQRFYADRVLDDAPWRPRGCLEQIRVEEYPDGHILALPGDPTTHVGLLVGGKLRLARISLDGREISIAFVTAKQPITRGRGLCRYQILTESSVLVAWVPFELWDDLLEKNRKFRERIDYVFEHRSALVERRLEMFGSVRSSQVRLARTLREMLEEFGDEDDTLPRFPHRVLATFAGMTRETASHAMERLISAGALEQTSCTFTVDRQTLDRLAGGGRR